MEVHPFERMPATQKSQRADWGKLVRRVGVQAALFFPGIGMILGWPLLAKRVFDGSGGYEVPDHLRLSYEEVQ